MAADLPADIEALVEAAVQRRIAALAPPPQRVVLFNLTLSGPRAGRDGADSALRAAGFQVRDTDCPYGDDTPPAEVDQTEDGAPVYESHEDRTARIRDEQARAWLVADMVMLREPSTADQDNLLARAAEAYERFGFALRMHGAGWTWRDQDGGR